MTTTSFNYTDVHPSWVHDRHTTSQFSNTPPACPTCHLRQEIVPLEVVCTQFKLKFFQNSIHVYWKSQMLVRLKIGWWLMKCILFVLKGVSRKVATKFLGLKKMTSLTWKWPHLGMAKYVIARTQISWRCLKLLSFNLVSTCDHTCFDSYHSTIAHESIKDLGSAFFHSLSYHVFNWWIFILDSLKSRIWSSWGNLHTISASAECLKHLRQLCRNTRRILKPKSNILKENF